MPNETLVSKVMGQISAHVIHPTEHALTLGPLSLHCGRLIVSHYGKRVARCLCVFAGRAVNNDACVPDNFPATAGMDGRWQHRAWRTLDIFVS
jgi:hypothetical protein